MPCFLKLNIMQNTVVKMQEPIYLDKLFMIMIHIMYGFIQTDMKNTKDKCISMTQNNMNAQINTVAFIENNKK